MDYNPNDKAQQRYVDSPVFADVFMILFAAALGIATWSCFTQASPQYVAGGIFGFFTLLLVYGLVSQKRRTFTFDKASQMMSWTSRGLRENKSGAVAFKDISTYLDSMTNNRAVMYRVMIETPEGTWPLTNAYSSGIQFAEKRMSEIRAIIGQPLTSPTDDSVPQIKQGKNVISAATIAGQETGESAPEVFMRITRE
jgi:hypothetical protein